MPEKPERETVTVEQIALTNMYQFEALLNVLERKGMVTSHQFLSKLALIPSSRDNSEIRLPSSTIKRTDSFLNSFV